MRTLLIFSFIVATSVAYTQDLTLFKKEYYTAANGDTLPYRLLMPEHYDRAKRYPLIIFLHGSGERGNDNEKQLTHGARFFLTDSIRRMFPAIVLFPQCPAEGYWSSARVDRMTMPLGLDFDYSRPATPPLAQAMELAKKIIREESVNKAQVYIIGLSMGGMGTFEAVYRHPGLFAAAVPICGGGDPARYDKRVKKIPFWVFHGDADGVVDVKHSRQMVQRLEALKASVKYTEYPGVNHNSWDHTLAEPGLLPWLFSHKR